MQAPHFWAYYLLYFRIIEAYLNCVRGLWKLLFLSIHKIVQDTSKDCIFDYYIWNGKNHSFAWREYQTGRQLSNFAILNLEGGVSDARVASQHFWLSMDPDCGNIQFSGNMFRNLQLFSFYIDSASLGHRKIFTIIFFEFTKSAECTSLYKLENLWENMM